MNRRAAPARSGPTQRDVDSADEALAQTFRAYGFHISSASEESVNDGAVPLLAPALVEDVIDLHGREPPAVMAVAGHGIKRVGHRENTCFDRNLLAGEVVGISRSIQTLVVVADTGKDVAELFQILEDRDADLDMSLNLAVLVGGQRSVFLQYLVIHANLADVVQQSRKVEVAAFLGRYRQFFRQADRDPRACARNARRCWDPWHRWPPSEHG